MGFKAILESAVNLRPEKFSGGKEECVYVEERSLGLRGV